MLSERKIVKAPARIWIRSWPIDSSTWTATPAFTQDVEYVRADLAGAERAAKILEDRADGLQREWDAPPSAENGFIAMTADTPAGYATWWGMNTLRKLATVIRENVNGSK